MVCLLSRRPALIVSLACVLLAPERGSAQPVQSFENLALRVNLDDRLRVENLSGETITGRLTHLTSADLAILTAAGEKPFTRDTVREISLATRPLRKSVLIGAGAGTVLGTLGGCVRAPRDECPDSVLMLGALGAGLGLAAGALIHTTKTVYRASEERSAASAPMSSLVAPAAHDRPRLTRPLQTFEDLGLLVNLADRLRVENESGVKTTGRLTRLTPDEITIQTDAGEKRFASATVREVGLRGFSLGRGALIGAGVFAAGFGVLACAARSGTPGCAAVPIGAGVIGAGVGLALGAVIPRITTVYRAKDK